MAQKILTQTGDYTLRGTISKVKNPPGINHVLFESRLNTSKNPGEFRKVSEIFLTDPELEKLQDLVVEARK